MIRVDLKTDKVTIGGRVSGTATWNSEGSKQPRKIEVMLRRRFMGKKTGEEIVASIADDDTASRSQIVVPFDFQVRLLEPPTYAGKLISIIWEIVATADMPWAVDQHDTKVVTVNVPVRTAEEYRQYCEEPDDGEDDEDDDDVNEPSRETGPAAR